MKGVQEFTAVMYGIKQYIVVNGVRFRIFPKNYSTKKDNTQFKEKN